MKILLVEDNLELANQVKTALVDADYTLDLAHDGKEAYFLGVEFNYAAIILDLGLPQLDGISVLKQWRANGIDTPVIVLTARDAWHEKVTAIDVGADDYVTKPFHIEELQARLRAIIRRTNGFSHSLIEVGLLSLDTKTNTIYYQKQPLSLTHHEYKLFSYLIHHPNQIISKSTLTEQLYEQDFDRDSNTVEVFIARLRKKLSDDLIVTVRGAGYLLKGEP